MAGKSITVTNTTQLKDLLKTPSALAEVRAFTIALNLGREMNNFTADMQQAISPMKHLTTLSLGIEGNFPFDELYKTLTKVILGSQELVNLEVYLNFNYYIFR